MWLKKSWNIVVWSSFMISINIMMVHSFLLLSACNKLFGWTIPLMNYKSCTSKMVKLRKTHSAGGHREFNRGSLVNKYMSESGNHKQVLSYNCSQGHSLIRNTPSSWSTIDCEQHYNTCVSASSCKHNKNMHQQIQTCALTRPDSESPLMLKGKIKRAQLQ